MPFLYFVFGAVAAAVTACLSVASFLLPSFSWWWGGSLTVAIWAATIACCRSTTPQGRGRSWVALFLCSSAIGIYVDILWIQASQDDPSVHSAVAERMERLYRGVTHDKVPLATREYDYERDRRQQVACNTPPKARPSPGTEWRREPPCSWIEVASTTPR